MTAKTEYQQLCQHFRTISHFEHFSALGDWDQATMMPMGGSEARSEAMAELALHIHSLKTAPRLPNGWTAPKPRPPNSVSSSKPTSERCAGTMPKP